MAEADKPTDGERKTLAEGAARTGRIAWEVQPDGSQRPTLQLDDGLVGFSLAFEFLLLLGLLLG